MQVRKNACGVAKARVFPRSKLLLALMLTAALPLNVFGPTVTVAAETETQTVDKENKSAADPNAEGEAQGRPLEMREKLAKRPYNFIQLSYMSVPEGGENEYLAVEAEWKKIQEARCRLGDMLFWGLLKVENPERMGCQ
ncbi:hypothetical protein N9D23_14050 [Rubripirellula sp.]|nr:hypothetical protein [Rubripirellula sp.]